MQEQPTKPQPGQLKKERRSRERGKMRKGCAENPGQIWRALFEREDICGECCPHKALTPPPLARETNRARERRQRQNCYRDTQRKFIVAGYVK